MDTKALADYVAQIMNEKKLTTRDVEKASGKSITHSYVNKIRNNMVKRPSSPSLQGLARGLGITEEELFAVARGKPLEDAEAIKHRVMDFNGFDNDDLKEIADYIEFKRQQKKSK